MSAFFALPKDSMPSIPIVQTLDWQPNPALRDHWVARALLPNGACISVAYGPTLAGQYSIWPDSDEDPIACRSDIEANETITRLAAR